MSMWITNPSDYCLRKQYTHMLPFIHMLLSKLVSFGVNKVLF